MVPQAIEIAQNGLANGKPPDRDDGRKMDQSNSV
jgi:hypothetical protein